MHTSRTPVYVTMYMSRKLKHIAIQCTKLTLTILSKLIFRINRAYNSCRYVTIYDLKT